MKVGILTFHFGINYGGVLQCYALQQYLTQNGHSVQIIDFLPPTDNAKKRLLPKSIKQPIKKTFNILKRCISNPILYRYGIIQKKKFQNFQKTYLNLTKQYRLSDLHRIDDEFDAIIVGSDQVWNKAQRDHAAYFLAPLNNFKGLRISYSPCCCINIVEERHRKLLVRSLQKFQTISVRNIETFQFVKDLINKEPPFVVDPVMLFDFGQLINKKFNFGEPYVLIYSLGSEIDGGHENVIKEIKRLNNQLSVYAVILTENKPKIFRWADKIYWHASVEEWLNLIYNASFIYTDSFHGVLFSLKFKKKFLAYYKDKTRASRFVDLIDRYNLENNIVDSFQSAIEKNAFSGLVDYESINLLIDENITKSKEFLKKALI